MLIALILLVALSLCCGTVVLLDSNAKRARQIEAKSKRLDAALKQVEKVARDYHDASPQMADVMLYEIDKAKRELEN